MRQELGGPDEPVGSEATHERLHGRDLARVHADDRLVVHDDLVPFERGLEIADDTAVQRRSEHRLVARIALRRVHLAVGARDQLARREPVLGEERPADRGIDLDQAAVDPIRPAESAPKPADERRGLVVARGAEREHDELVAADARHGVNAADDGLETLRDHAEDGVADLVAADVVHTLEPVEVDDEEGERLGRPVGAGERLLDPIVEERPVGQAGERIAEHGSLGQHEVRDEDVRGRCAEERERGDEDGCGEWAPVLGESHAEEGADGDHEGSGRRPDEPTARSLPVERLAHSLPPRFSRPDATERALLRSLDRRGEPSQRPVPEWGVQGSSFEGEDREGAW